MASCCFTASTHFQGSGLKIIIIKNTPFANEDGTFQSQLIRYVSFIICPLFSTQKINFIFLHKNAFKKGLMCYVSFSWVFYTISTTMPYRCQAEPGEGRLKHYHPPHHRVCKKPEQLLIPDQGLFPPVILMPAEVRGNTLGKNAVFSG